MDFFTLNFSRQRTVSPFIEAGKFLQRRDRKENTESVAQVLGSRLDFTSPFLRNRTESRVRHKPLSAAESRDQQNEEFRPKICSAGRETRSGRPFINGFCSYSLCTVRSTGLWTTGVSTLTVSGLSGVPARSCEVVLSDSVHR